MRARPGNQERDRKRSVPLGDRQGPGDPDSLGPAVIGDVGRGVRERAFGQLGPADLGDLGDLLQGQRERHARLLPRADRLEARLVDLPLVVADVLDRQLERVLADLGRGDLQAEDALIQAIHRGPELVAFPLEDMERQPELEPAVDRERPFPDVRRPNRTIDPGEGHGRRREADFPVSFQFETRRVQLRPEFASRGCQQGLAILEADPIEGDGLLRLEFGALHSSDQTAVRSFLDPEDQAELDHRIRIEEAFPGPFESRRRVGQGAGE